MSVDDLIRGEGDQWHQRNRSRARRPEDDHLLAEIRTWAGARPPSRVLEIGCAEGWRLAELVGEFGCAGFGLDASVEAVRMGHEEFPELSLAVGVAPNALVEFENEGFDLIVLGFFQYYMPRPWQFRLAFEVDRILSRGGRIVTYDFISNIPRATDNTHQPELRVHKSQPSAPWLWNPEYFLVGRRTLDHDSLGPVGSDPNEWITIDTILKLDSHFAYA